MWMRTCVFKLPLCENCAPRVSHLNGYSLVWICTRAHTCVRAHSHALPHKSTYILSLFSVFPWRIMSQKSTFNGKSLRFENNTNTHRNTGTHPRTSTHRTYKNWRIRKRSLFWQEVTLCATADSHNYSSRGFRPTTTQRSGHFWARSEPFSKTWRPRCNGRLWRKKKVFSAVNPFLFECTRAHTCVRAHSHALPHKSTYILSLFSVFPWRIMSQKSTFNGKSLRFENNTNTHRNTGTHPRTSTPKQWPFAGHIRIGAYAKGHCFGRKLRFAQLRILTITPHVVSAQQRHNAVGISGHVLNHFLRLEDHVVMDACGERKKCFLPLTRFYSNVHVHILACAHIHTHSLIKARTFSVCFLYSPGG